MSNLDTLDKTYVNKLENELDTIDKTFFSKESDLITKEEVSLENTEENRLASFLYDNSYLETIEKNNELKNTNEECTALVTVKERRLLAAQTMFKKSIKVTIKSFLISLSLSFLNLFI